MRRLSDTGNLAFYGGLTVARIATALTPLTSVIYAYATIPSLTGLAGVLGAIMVGGGTAATMGVGGLVGGALGTAFGFAASRLRNRDFSLESLGKLGTAGAVGATLGAIAAIPVGYGTAKDIVVNGTKDKAAITETIESGQSSNHIVLPDGKVAFVPG